MEFLQRNGYQLGVAAGIVTIAYWLQGRSPQKAIKAEEEAKVEANSIFVSVSNVASSAPEGSMKPKNSAAAEPKESSNSTRNESEVSAEEAIAELNESWAHQQAHLNTYYDSLTLRGIRTPTFVWSETLQAIEEVWRKTNADGAKAATDANAAAEAEANAVAAAAAAVAKAPATVNKKIDKVALKLAEEKEKEDAVKKKKAYDKAAKKAKEEETAAKKAEEEAAATAKKIEDKANNTTARKVKREGIVAYI